MSARRAELATPSFAPNRRGRRAICDASVDHLHARPCDQLHTRRRSPSCSSRASVRAPGSSRGPCSHAAIGAVSLRGTDVDTPDVESDTCLALCDGTRTRAEIAAAMAEDLAKPIRLVEWMQLSAPRPRRRLRGMISSLRGMTCAARSARKRSQSDAEIDTRVSICYDRVAYPGTSDEYYSPNRLRASALLHGFRPPDPRRPRCLRSVAATGSTSSRSVLRRMTRLVGFDLSSEAIERGRALVDAAGLKNVDLHVGDALTYPRDGEKFDYIVCHGVLSWVPAAGA